MTENKEHTDCSCLCEIATGTDFCWVDGSVDSPVGSVPRVATSLVMRDRIGWWRVRWAMARDKFIVPPGLYAVGNPTSESHVFVSANYKMSFDCLRQSLAGIDAWMLVLDTKGINVWCAAGKGTFATAELVSRIDSTNLSKVVSHRRLILPQLSAAGLSAHKLASLSGFRVTYGPVRAEDIPSFLNGKMDASAEMRQVRFGIAERIILTPVEMVISFKYAFLISAVAVLLSGLGPTGYSYEQAIATAPSLMLVVCAGWLGGSFLGPTLLPVLPGRSFSAKGAAAGLLALGMLIISGRVSTMSLTAFVSLSLIAIALASFLTMNFTGCSTYTSPSGVRKEMRIAVPLQALFVVIGTVVWIASLFFWR